MAAFAAFIAALIGECIKLFDMRQINAHLLAHPLPQADFHRPMAVGHERAKGQAFGRIAVIFKGAKLQRPVMSAQNRRADINQNIGAVSGVCVAHRHIR